MTSAPAGDLVAWCPAPGPAARVAVVGRGVRQVLDVADAVALAARIEAERPVRWVWWAAADAYPPLLAAGVRPARVWDVAEAHRLIAGGWKADPGRAWAGAHGLDPAGVPAPPTGDLFELLAEAEAQAALAAAGPPGGAGPGGAVASGLPADDPDSPVRPDGHLRPDAVTGAWITGDARLLAWAEASLECARGQHERAARTHPRLTATTHSESAAAALAVELQHDGLPIDRARMLQIVEPLSGPAHERDAAVLRHVPGLEHTDLRNPAAVRAMLAHVGIDVPSTRKHVLAAYRDAHPVVPALLEWRKAERIATTYGLRWLDECVGPDDRLRGAWTACDGAGGRMTAENGLHNLPAMLRPGVAAEAGHVFVRADLGQVEPRVLAVVSGDEAFAQATAADDLYLPVARRLGAERATAKVAVLAAMYGQRSGAAGEALRGLERAYPVAMAHLDRAYEQGRRGRPVRTYGGRLVHTGRFAAQTPPGADTRLDGARGRFARNAVIQGAAAELFKAWAATVRATTRGLDARIVLCLHDELLVHVPERHARAAAAAVDQALTDAARRWSGGAPVRFVADTSVIHRWSEAKE